MKKILPLTVVFAAAATLLLTRPWAVDRATAEDAAIQYPATDSGSAREPRIPQTSGRPAPSANTTQNQAKAREAIIPTEAEPVSETPYTTLTESELFALEQSFEALHYDATRAQLLEAYAEAMERIPEDAIETLHFAKIQQGDFEVLDVPTEKGENYIRFTYTPEVLQSNKPVLSMTHSQTDGRLLRTWIQPAALPGFEQDILYVNWMMDRIRGRR